MNFNLSFKYSFFSIILITTITTIFTIVLINMHSKSLENQITKEAEYYCIILESSVAENIISLRIDQIIENIFFIKQNPHIEYIYVLDPEGRIITTGEFRNLMYGLIPDDEFHNNAVNSKSILVQKNAEIIDASSPIQLGSEKLGYVRIGISTKSMYNEIHEFRSTAVFMGILFIIIGSFLTYFVVLRMSKPLKKLTNLTHEISKGKFDKKIELKTTDEINTLANAFNDMSDNLYVTRNSLVSAKNEAERSNKLKTDFLAQISHEIRTPISTLINYSSLIKEKVNSKKNSEIAEYFDVIDNAGKRITRTVDLTLNMSEIIRGDYKPSFQTFDINIELLRALYTEFESAATVKKLDFIFEDSKENCLVYTDKYTATQIFQNLIDNAIKYTKHGFVKIKSVCHADIIIVSIIDSGEGISEEFQLDMFEPFRQEDQGYTRKYEGAGLGLSLVYKYCELTGASINVDSKKGKGTSFQISFNKGKK